MALTVEQVTGMATDAGAAKNGLALAAERKWAEFGRQGDALWGLCQGSGSTPYQVRVDLSGPAYKCSCPSHKLPCKHSLGLMFLHAGKPELFAAEKPSEFLREWLVDREKRAEQKAQKQVEKAGEEDVDPETAARRQSSRAARVASREDKVAAGIAELALLLRDTVREGLASLSGKPFAFWDGIRKRLIDAQAPGLARQIGELGTMGFSGNGWQERAMHRIARLHLACEAWGRLDLLPDQTKTDLRSFIGFNVAQEELLNGPTERDIWFVMAQQFKEEDKLRSVRTWLWSDSGRAAVLYQFAYVNQPLEIKMAPRTAVDAEVAFFPGSTPLRALPKAILAKSTFRRPSGLPGIDAMLADFAGRAALNPWCDSWPYLLVSVLPVCRDGEWFIQDPAATRDGLAVPVRNCGNAGWRMLALSGGHPRPVFGEWNGESFEPLAVFDEQEHLVGLTDGEET